MLNPYYGLFQYSTDNIYMLQINPDSSINPVSIHAYKEGVNWKIFVNRYSGLVSVYSL